MAFRTRWQINKNSARPDQSLPHDKHCDLCAAYAHIGNAIGSSSINFASSENYETQHLNAIQFLLLHYVRRIRGARPALLRIKHFYNPRAEWRGVL